MNKKIVFSFYANRENIYSEVNKLHLKCLKKYSHIFDTAIICVILDDENDSELFQMVKDLFLPIFNRCHELTFKTFENGKLREAKVFYDCVYKELGNDDLVFFGHNKGTTNILQYGKENIYKWICGMYYYSLEFMDEVNDKLISKKYFSYGPFYTRNEEATKFNKYGWYYIGTFFWINSKKIKNYISINNIVVPELSDRFFAEEFLGDIFDFPIGSHLDYYLVNAMDFYNHCAEYIDILYPNDVDFDNFYKKMTNLETDIQIIYIATNGYKNYAEDFIFSLKNFFPGLTKKITILSDGSLTFNISDNLDIVDIDFIKIPDMIYPTMNINKTYFVEKNIDDSCRYVFYFDADTIIKENESYDWGRVKEELDSGKIMLTKHPFYALEDGENWFGAAKEDLISNFFSENMTDRNNCHKSYIAKNEYVYINSAFYGARCDKMREFSKRITEMESYDLTRHFIPDADKSYFIPQFIDENYFNKIANDEEECGFDFSIKQYSQLYNSNSKNIDSIFMYQKNMGDFKTNRR